MKKLEENPFCAEDVISYYHNNAVWKEQQAGKGGRAKANNENKKLENLERAKQLYVDVLKLIDRNLREKYGYSDELLKTVKTKLLNRVDNKVRSNGQGELFVQIGDSIYYTGAAKEYEKFFSSSKRNFNKVIKAIANELLNVLNDKAFKETGKSLKHDNI
jgi:hypothetical protein